MSRLLNLLNIIPRLSRVLMLRMKGVDISFYANISAHTDIAKGCKIANGVCIQKHVSISGNVTIGEGSTIGAYTSLSTMPNGYIRIGKRVLINRLSTIGASESVTIGDNCIFAAYIQITDAEHGFEDRAVLIREAPWTSSPVVIEENVWLGTQVAVLKGSRIGKGSVIGAKSLVNKLIPEYSIAYGIPISVKRVRN